MTIINLFSLISALNIPRLFQGRISWFPLGFLTPVVLEKISDTVLFLKLDAFFSTNQKSQNTEGNSKHQSNYEKSLIGLILSSFNCWTLQERTMIPSSQFSNSNTNHRKNTGSSLPSCDRSSFRWQVWNVMLTSVQSHTINSATKTSFVNYQTRISDLLCCRRPHRQTKLKMMTEMAKPLYSHLHESRSCCSRLKTPEQSAHHNV